MELENIQSLLQCAGIEVDLKTLQNPTEEFMINLVTEYLKRFNFDGNEIAKPTPEELDRVSCGDSAFNAIKAINLHAALATICEGIFLKDLTLTDITSPGCKKACKRIKVLFNFFVYVKNKKMEKEHLFYELEDRQKEFQNFIDKKFEIIATVKSVINERENKIEYAKKMKQEIVQITQQIEKSKKEVWKLQEEVEEAAEVYQGKLHNLHTLKAKAHELHKVTKDLQSKIVKCPEDYLSKTNELKVVLEQKVEERQIVNDCIARKKHQIKNNELAETEVNQCYSKVMGLGEAMLNFKETTAELQSVKNQIKELKNEIKSLERQLSDTPQDELTSSITIDFEKSEKLLCELQKSLTDKQKEHDKLEKKLAKIRADRSRLTSALKKEKELILTLENDCSSMLKNYEVQFNAELAEELDFRKGLDQLLALNES